MSSKETNQQKLNGTKKERSQAALLNILTNADQSQNKEQSSKPTIEYHREPMEGTPFYLVGNNEEGYIITMGKYRVSKRKYPTIIETYGALEVDKWEILFNMIVSTIEMNEERNKPE